MKRVRYVVSPAKRAGNWQLTSKGRAAYVMGTQAAAIRAGASICRQLWADGQPAELIIKGRNGRIRDNRTYGNDPKRIRG